MDGRSGSDQNPQRIKPGVCTLENSIQTQLHIPEKADFLLAYVGIDLPERLEAFDFDMQ